MRRLKSDKVMKIPRLSGCKNFVTEREVYIRCLTLSQWRELRMGVICVDLGALTTAEF